MATSLPGALSRLTKEHIPELVDLLAMGKKDGEITDHIQKNMGLLTDVRRETLLRAVNRWRKGSGEQAVMLRATGIMTDSNGNLKKQIDIFAEIEALVIKQKARLQTVYKMEDGKQLLLGTVTNEMKFMLDLVEKRLLHLAGA